MTPIEILLFFGKFVALPAASAFVGAIVKSRMEDRRLFKLQDTRRLAGKWPGKISFPGTKYPSEPLTFEFYQKRPWHIGYWLNPRMVDGVVKLEGDSIEFRGGFCTPQHLLLDYRAADRRVHQFGSMLLTLDSGATTLTGDIIGYYDETFAAEVALSAPIQAKLTSTRRRAH